MDARELAGVVFYDHPLLTLDRVLKSLATVAPRGLERITRREMDLARSIQVVTEEVMAALAKHACEITGCRDLALAGGQGAARAPHPRPRRSLPWDTELPRLAAPV